MIKTDYDREALLKIKKGRDTVADMVKKTYGPRGSNVIIDRPGQTPLITTDGVTVADAMILEDRTENMGAEGHRLAARKTDEESGDATSTCIILGQAIDTEGMKHLEDDCSNGVAIQEEIQEATEQILKELDKMAIPVKDLAKVASISAKSEKIGAKVAEIVDKIGIHGVVDMEESNKPGITSEIIVGLKFPKGFASFNFVNNNERQVAEYKNVRVLMTRKRLASARDLVDLLKKQGSNREMVIIAEDFSEEVIATLALAKASGTFSAVAIKAPGFSDLKEYYYQDINAVVGGEIHSDESGIELTDFTAFGVAKKITVFKEETIIMGADENSVKDHVKVLKAQQKVDQYPEDYDKRIAALTGGIAKIMIGATTEQEYNQLRLRINDSIKSAQSALEEGIIPGGGYALYKIAEKIDNPIMKKAIQVPYKIIGEVADDIVDPVKATKSALRNAAASAGLFLATGGALTRIVDKDK